MELKGAPSPIFEKMLATIFKQIKIFLSGNNPREVNDRQLIVMSKELYLTEQQGFY